jgi:hypothetical protein
MGPTFSTAALDARERALDAASVYLASLAGDHQEAIRRCHVAKTFLGMGHVRQSEMAFRAVKTACEAAKVSNPTLEKQIRDARDLP